MLFFMSLFELDVYWQVAARCVGVVECDICRCSGSIFWVSVYTFGCNLPVRFMCKLVLTED